MITFLSGDPMRKLLLILIAVAMFRAPAAAQTMEPALVVKQGLTKEQRQKNVESFETAWQTVRDTHYDPKLAGVNWQTVHQELRPRMEKADSMADARKIMNEMLGRLGHSHVGIIPAGLYDDDSASGKTGHVIPRAVPGFDVRVVAGEPLVTRVSAGLPAAKAGVRPGWLVRKINGKDLAPKLLEVRQATKKSADVPFEQAITIQQQLRGEEGKEVTVTFVDASNKEVTLPISRAMPIGNRFQFAQMPPEFVHFEARTLDDNVGYFYLSSFLDPVRVMKAFGETVQANVKSDGFILDLRGNPGGLIVMAQGLGGWFVNRPNLKLGTMTDRSSSQHLILNPRGVTYKGPLAILVDEFSASSSEFLAGGLQDLKRARVFGRPTPGAALPSKLLRLPNGDRLQYVVADYVSANGKRLEDNGVQPDEIVAVDRQSLLDGRDPILDAAMRWIRVQR